MNELPIEFIASQHQLPFSTGVRVGDVLYLSGQIGVRSDGSLADGFQAQARQAIDNIAASLDEVGSSMASVFKCTIMMADMARWNEFNTIYCEYFEAGRFPVRSAFGANGLALGADVEIECWAYVPR